MENYVYEKAYPIREELEAAVRSDDKEEVAEYLRRCRRSKRKTAHLVIPPTPQIFERLIADCEMLVKEFCGKIRATIDYSAFSATIELWCDYVEFRDDEFLCILQRVAFYATTIRISPLATGTLHIWIDIPYFFPLPEAKDLR